MIFYDIYFYRKHILYFLEIRTYITIQHYKIILQFLKVKHTHAHERTHIHIYIYTHTHTHTHIYIYIYTV